MMQPAPRKASRCAIYTRKSTEHNLDLEFNSLDAQREACEAYIKSQAHEGWRLIRTRYDDGGLSGAPLARRLRQAGGTLRPAFRLVRLDHPVLQYDDQHGTADPQRPVVICAVRAGGHRRAGPGQDCGLE